MCRSETRPSLPGENNFSLAQELFIYGSGKLGSKNTILDKLSK
jgi:hypothetical protein